MSLSSPSISSSSSTTMDNEPDGQNTREEQIDLPIQMHTQHDEEVQIATIAKKKEKEEEGLVDNNNNTDSTQRVDM